jgi:hypothetical protein
MVWLFLYDQDDWSKNTHKKRLFLLWSKKKHIHKTCWALFTIKSWLLLLLSNE